MALHFGERLQRGHYRVIARQWQNRSPFHQSTWITDDNHPAQQISLAEATDLSQLAYIIWCRRC